GADFGARRGAYGFRGGASSNLRESGTVAGDEQVPCFALAVGERAGNGRRTSDVAHVVVHLTPDVDAHDLARAHLPIEVIVADERIPQRGEPRVRTAHRPRPERHAAPAGPPPALAHPPLRPLLPLPPPHP